MIKLLLTSILVLTDISHANECLKRITSSIEKNTKNTPGVGLIVIQDGKTLYKKALGYTDIEKKIKAKNTTPFSLCSMTKMITAQAILQLEEKGLLSIDDKVANYIDLLPDYAKDVKISNLIFHNSGIPDYNNDNQELKNMTFEKAMKTNFIVDENYINNFIMNNKAKFKIGTQYSYSNSGYWILARIIEKVSGKSYADYVNGNIFTKIGTKNSFININNTGNLEIQPHQTWPLTTKIPNVFSTISKNTDGDGGAFMSLDDYENYIKIAFLDGKIFEKLQTHEKFMSDGFEIKKGKTYGFGLEHNNTTANKKISHDGGTHGYRSNITYYPEKNLVVAMFFGTETFAQTVLPNEIGKCFDGDKKLS
jgi:CubicO group peptidase (beta-lactamase class C family)